MHELFTLGEFPPVPPGTSPFQFRGVIYERTVEHANRIAGSLEAFLADVADERVRAFMRQPFRWNGLYDALPLCPVQISLSRLQGREFDAATRARAAEGAQQLIPRMFRLVLAFTKARAWALHAPRLMGEYCGFGDIKVERAGDEGAVFGIAAIPQFVAASHCATLAGIFEGSLVSLRAKDVASRPFDVKLAGELNGLSLLSYRLELTWR